MPSSSSITIIGAGLAGSLLACYLGRRGIRVDVFERRPDPRVHGFLGGRSINLALSARGIAALEHAGLAGRVLADAIPMRARMMHGVDASLTRQPYSKNPTDAINSVSRGGLNITLIEAAAACAHVTLHFGQRCIDLDLDRPAATFEDESTGAVRTVAADVIIGADGAFSAVRARLQKNIGFDYSQSFLAHGYKELVIPPTPEGEFAIEPEVLHIWPRGGLMMIALPNKDRSFTCTCFWPNDLLESLRTPDQILDYFRTHFADAVPIMPTLVEDYQANPIGALVTVRCAPWHVGRVAVIGDAAHAVVPFYGQGMNAAFEDCLELDRCIDACTRDGVIDWSATLARLTERRVAHADAIADMALDNFVEMRDHTASTAFLIRKKGETLLHRFLPGWYRPLYYMISFTTIPYADARALARRQGRLVRNALVAALVLAAALVIGLVWILRR
ncbi:MAG: FAD-dependent monooxygenase [Phycisphaerales bacterium]|nr:FAD-dependent monooxygenase [Phycisphaerales bacterium]